MQAHAHNKQRVHNATYIVGTYILTYVDRMYNVMQIDLVRMHGSYELQKNRYGHGRTGRTSSYGYLEMVT